MIVEVIDRYLHWKQFRRGLGTESLKTLGYRLRGLLEPVYDYTPRGVSKELAVDLVEEYFAGNTKPRRPDTVYRTVSEAQSWAKWCVRKKLVDTNVWDIELNEDMDDFVYRLRRLKVRPGAKPQLGEDEARLYVASTVPEAVSCPRGAAAASLICLYMGFRASETLGLTPRRVDSSFRSLRVMDAKTHNGDRRQGVPPELSPLLQLACEGVSADERIYTMSRQSLYRSVQALCQRAGVEEVGVHGLRRTHSTLARGEGESAYAVARSIGHGSYMTTKQSYVAPGTDETVDAQRVASRLGTGVTWGHESA